MCKSRGIVKSITAHLLGRVSSKKIASMTFSMSNKNSRSEVVCSMCQTV